MNERIRHLTHDLDLSDLHVYFQPVYNVRTGQVLGLEALLRPVGPEGEMVAPGIVFERAEKSDLLLDLEREARILSLEAFARQKNDRNLVLFLNFSSVLLDHGQLDPGRILATVEEFDLPPAAVGLELVESGVSVQSQLAAFARRNRDAGFLIILDDFGTEHSNLERVAVVKPDIIKIDRSIVSGSSRDPVKRSVLRSVAYLSRTIGALSLAEGIEHYEDLVACAEEGVELGQGFLLGRPAPSVDRACAHRRSAATDALTRLKSDLAASLQQASHAMSEVEAAISDLVNELAGVPGSDMESHLQTIVASSGLIESAFVCDGAGVQVTDTVLTDGQRPAERHPIFQPAARGTDHSLKDYVYGLLALGRPDFLSAPYISLATGSLVRTHSRRFVNADGTELILCVDAPTD